MKRVIPSTAGQLSRIRKDEPYENRLQTLAEEAAELAQAALKLLRAEGRGSYTPCARVSCFDKLAEETADLLLALDASFPREYPPDMAAFWEKVDQYYRFKAGRWVERLERQKEEP